MIILGSFFQSIADSISSWFDLVVNTIQNTAFFYRILIALGEVVTQLFPRLPFILGGCFYAVISFSIFKFILGRMSS